MVNKTESIRQWFRTCPLILESAKTGINYLSDSPTEYAIFSVPSVLDYKENILGEQVLADIQSESFTFASVEDYGADAQTNAEQLYFYQQIAAWIIEQNNRQNFPEWDGKVLSVLPVQISGPLLLTASTAQYEIEIKVTYRRH